MIESDTVLRNGRPTFLRLGWVGFSRVTRVGIPRKFSRGMPKPTKSPPKIGGLSCDGLTCLAVGLLSGRGALRDDLPGIVCQFFGLRQLVDRRQHLRICFRSYFQPFLLSKLADEDLRF